MDIAALLLWFVTAGAGLYLLLAGRPSPVVAGQESAEAPAPATVPPSPPPQAGLPQTGLPQAGLPQATVDALAAGAKVPPITHTRIKPPPGQHPLLEFMHPALGIIGLGFWMAFVATHFHAFAWVSFGVLVATIAAGLTWYTVNRRSAARARPSTKPATGGRRYPPRRILIHGGAAGTTLILALITLLITVHG